MNLSSVWHLSDLYFHMCIGFVVVGCYCLCECRPIAAGDWTFGHVSNLSGLDNSEVTTTGHQESPEITNEMMSDENREFPKNGQDLTTVLSVDDVIKRETIKEEMEDTDVRDEVQNEIPPNHVLPSLRPPTRWSKVKFTLIEVAIFVALFLNIFLLNMALVFCRTAQHQAGVIVRAQKKNLREYTSVNPDSD